MIIFLCALVAICLYKIKFSRFHTDYMGFSATGAIKGIFAVIILFSHMTGYVEIVSTLGNNIFAAFLARIGQLMVTMFFFYSGYGIMESYQKKPNYEKGFLKNRAVKTLVHFDIAVLLYLLLNIVIGRYYEWQSYVFCWIGWETIGNSNWFVFDMLLLYSITWFALKMVRRLSRMRNIWLLVLVSVLSIGAWIVLAVVKGTVCWYNTLLCYPFGMAFSMIKPKLEKAITQKCGRYYLITGIVLATFAATYLMEGEISYSIAACLFTLLLTLISVKVQINNRVLQWLGKYSFSIYILQRLPMRLFEHLGWNANAVVFSLVSIAATLLLSVVFQKLLDSIDGVLFKRERMECVSAG